MNRSKRRYEVNIKSNRTRVIQVLTMQPKLSLTHAGGSFEFDDKDYPPTPRMLHAYFKHNKQSQ